MLSLNILSFWTYGVTNFLEVNGITYPPICHFIFSIFVLKTLELEWHHSQYLKLNPTCVSGEHLDPLVVSKTDHSLGKRTCSFFLSYENDNESLIDS